MSVSSTRGKRTDPPLSEDMADVWQREAEAARQRYDKMEPATKAALAPAKVEQLVELLRGLRLNRQRELPAGTSVRLPNTPLKLTLDDDVRMHALFTIRRWTAHDPSLQTMDPLTWQQNLGFTSAELSAMAEHGVAPYLDEAWTLTSAYMGYKQYYDPTDDYHLEGMLWLGKARDPSLVYRGEAEFRQARDKDGKLQWTAFVPQDKPRRRKAKKNRKRSREKMELR